jgi:regulator of protease activity HflC (stomatin/prohibitin superfamily)
MTLDSLYESQGEISKSVSDQLKSKMARYGYTIVDTLVNDIVPAKKVSEAMNDINASERLKMAATNIADADYIKAVRHAESDRDRKVLQGEGISGQRIAILKGYENGIEDMSKNLGLSSKDVIDFVMKTQHLDMLEQIGSSNNTKTVFLSHQPEGLSNKFTDSMMHASEK